MIGPADKPEEMRAELFRLRQYDPLVRAIMDAADYNNLSAEDRYTILAYRVTARIHEIELRLRALEYERGGAVA